MLGIFLFIVIPVLMLVCVYMMADALEKKK